MDVPETPQKTLLKTAFQCCPVKGLRKYSWRVEKTNLTFLDVTQSIHQGQWRRASLEQSALEGQMPTCS